MKSLLQRCYVNCYQQVINIKYQPVAWYVVDGIICIFEFQTEGFELISCKYQCKGGAEVVGTSRHPLTTPPELKFCSLYSPKSSVLPACRGILDAVKSISHVDENDCFSMQYSQNVTCFW